MAVVDRGLVNTFFNNPFGPVNRHLRTVAEDVRQRASSKVIRLGRVDASRTGPHLADSIGVVPGRDGVGQYYDVGSNLPHARVHHEGSRPHIIRPKGKALQFFWPKVGADTVVPVRPSSTGFRRGVFIIGKGYVNHPGTSPNRYLLDAAREVIGG